MIRIPLYLAVAQWALLVALAVLVVLMYRQLGSMMRRDGAPAQLGPPPGELAQALPYTEARSGQPRVFSPGEGTGALLAFVDPTCPACEQLVTVLTDARDDGDLGDLQVLLVTSDPPAYLEISPAFQATSLEIGRPADPDALDSYQARATPMLVAIDGSGVVRAAGSVIRRSEVLGYARASQLPPGPDPQSALPVLAAAPAGASTASESGPESETIS